MKRLLALLVALSFLTCSITAAFAESVSGSAPGSFMDAAAEWLNGLDPEKYDYGFFVQGPGTALEGVFRKDPELTEIDMGDQGRIVLSGSEIGIEQNGISIIVDLEDASQLMSQNALQPENVIKDIQWLSERAKSIISEAFLPYVNVSSGKNGLSVHVAIDDRTALLKLTDCLDTLLGEKETEEIFNRYSPYLGTLFQGSRISYDMLKSYVAGIRKDLGSRRSTSAVNMDLDIVLDNGRVSSVSCFGSCSLSYREIYNFDFRYKGAADGWHTEGYIKDVTYGSTLFSLDLTKSNSTTSGKVTISETELTVSAVTGESGETAVRLDSNVDLSADVKFDKQHFAADIFYRDEVISASAGKEEDQVTAALKTTSSDRSAAQYDYDFRMNRLPNGNWRVRLTGIDQAWGMVRARHYVNAEIGENKIAVSYSDNPLTSSGYELEAERNGKDFRFRIHMPGFNWHGQDMGYNLLIQKEGMVVKTEFAFLHLLWYVSGNGSVLIDRDQKIRTLTGVVSTQYLPDPDKTETHRLIYSPGELMYVDDLGIYRLKKTEDTARTIRYRLTHNSRLEAEVTANLTESGCGDGMEITITDQNRNQMRVSVEPLEKTGIVPINQDRAIRMSLELFLSQVLNSGY